MKMCEYVPRPIPSFEDTAGDADRDDDPELLQLLDQRVGQRLLLWVDVAKRQKPMRDVFRIARGSHQTEELVLSKTSIDELEHEMIAGRVGRGGEEEGRVSVLEKQVAGFLRGGMEGSVSRDSPLSTSRRFTMMVTVLPVPDEPKPTKGFGPTERLRIHRTASACRAFCKIAELMKGCELGPLEVDSEAKMGNEAGKSRGERLMHATSEDARDGELDVKLCVTAQRLNRVSELFVKEDGRRTNAEYAGPN